MVMAMDMMMNTMKLSKPKLQIQESLSMKWSRLTETNLEISLIVRSLNLVKDLMQLMKKLQQLVMQQLKLLLTLSQKALVKRLLLTTRDMKAIWYTLKNCSIISMLPSKFKLTRWTNGLVIDLSGLRSFMTTTTRKTSNISLLRRETMLLLTFRQDGKKLIGLLVLVVKNLPQTRMHLLLTLQLRDQLKKLPSRNGPLKIVRKRLLMDRPSTMHLL